MSQTADFGYSAILDETSTEQQRTVLMQMQTAARVLRGKYAQLQRNAASALQFMEMGQMPFSTDEQLMADIIRYTERLNQLILTAQMIDVDPDKMGAAFVV
jgi:hypothetical protein